MARSVEKEIKEEIKKAEIWYRQKYKKPLEVHYRYDKQEKHFSWRLVAVIGGAERVLAFGISAESAEGPTFPAIKARLLDYIKVTLTKAQAKWEPMILGMK